MTTYDYGRCFSYPALAIWLALLVGFILAPEYRLRIFIAMIVPAVILIAGYLSVRCRQCGKSAFLKEIFSEDTLVGKATNPRRPTPEQTCSRCRADLTAQER